MRAFAVMAVLVAACSVEATDPATPATSERGFQIVNDAHGVALTWTDGVAELGTTAGQVRVVEPAGSLRWDDDAIVSVVEGREARWTSDEAGLHARWEMPADGSPFVWTVSGPVARSSLSAGRVGHLELGDLVARDAAGRVVEVAGAFGCDAPDRCALSVSIDDDVAHPVFLSARLFAPDVTPPPAGVAGELAAALAGLNGLASTTTCFRDDDGDGFGRDDDTTPVPCAAPYVSVSGDCDDGEVSVYPGAVEVSSDGIDQDCDGDDALFVMADLGPGDLVITELMRNPAAVGDDRGEWFEVENRSGVPVSLSGLYLYDHDSDQQRAGVLNVDVGQRVVFGVEVDPELNGGYEPNAVYNWRSVGSPAGSGLVLANSSTDELVISPNPKPLSCPNASNCVPDPAAFDTVIWTNSWPGNSPAGRSMNLHSAFIDHVDNDTANRWCAANQAYGDGDLGTPGNVNRACNQGQAGTYPDPAPPASMSIQYTWTNAANPALSFGECTTVDFAPGGTFTTGNDGEGTWAVGTRTGATWVVFTYVYANGDLGPTYRGTRPDPASAYSGVMRFGHPWTGTWQQVASCPPVP